MRFIKKFILFSGLFLCVIVLVLSGMGLYLYYHPERIKPMIENSFSTTGSSCTIESLSWSFRPMTLAAKGISFETRMPHQSVSLKIPFIHTDMTISGPWGRKFLNLENMQITGISLDFTSSSALPAEKKTSFTASVAQGLVSFFFFRDIKFQSGEILDGQLTASLGNQNIQARQIHASAGIGKPLSLSFAMDIQNTSRDMQVTAPNVTLSGGSALDINDPALSGTLQAENIKYQDIGLEIQHTDIKSTFTYRHALKNLNIENLDVRCKDLTLIGKSDEILPVKDISLKAENISSRYPVIEVTNVVIEVPRSTIHIGTRNISINDIRFHIPEGRIDAEKRSISFPNVRCDTANLKNMLVAIDRKDDKINWVLQGENTGLLQAASEYLLLPADWDFSAGDAIRIDVIGPEAGPWQVKTKLSFEKLAFTNKAGSRMGEKISFTTATDGVIDLKHASMTFAAELTAKTGEALYDRYYIDFAQNPAVMSCNGTYRFGEGFLQVSRLRFDLTDILPLEIKGFLKQGSSMNSQSTGDADFAINIPVVSLQPIFHHLIQEPYQTEMPLLATLDIGGTVSAGFKIKKSENAWQVQGRIGWQEGSLAFRDGSHFLKGIHLDLPVWYQTGLAEPPKDWLKGKLSVQSLSLSPLPEQPLNMLLEAGPNRISVAAPTVIQVPGGNIRLGSVQVENIFSPDISVLSNLAFDGINLPSLLSGIGMLPPDGITGGTLTGELAPIRYKKHSVTSQGEITAEIFGGNIVLSDLGASGILTSAPVFKLNAHWDDLLLAKMTTDTQFGKIEGVLKGYMTDVEIADGQPQRFVLLLETVKTKKIPQTISIKAVDNIAQIGGGQSPFMGLAGAFASVFERFPYEKIGIRARLENDIFTVNGTIREGGTEYLIKRSGFSGVNIVNQNPDNRTSFRDMVKRIKRITHKGGMVVE